MGEIGRYKKQSATLKQLRRIEQKRLDEMAVIAGVSKSYWSQIENGQRKIPEESIQNLQKKFANFTITLSDEPEGGNHHGGIIDDYQAIAAAKERAEAKLEIYKTICDKLLDKAVVVIGADMKGVLGRLENDVAELTAPGGRTHK